ncbi:MAG: metal-sensitive transcriptional regulator [Candidatus Dormibacteria bacterium]
MSARTDRAVPVGEGSPLPEELVAEVLNRLRRAEGQLRGVQRLLSEGADCSKVIGQLAAANRAVEQAGFRLVAGGLAWCVQRPEAAAAAGYRVDDLERLFTRIS